MGADSEVLTPEAPECLTVAEAGGVGPGEGAKRHYPGSGSLVTGLLCTQAPLIGADLRLRSIKWLTTA